MAQAGVQTRRGGGIVIFNGVRICQCPGRRDCSFVYCVCVPCAEGIEGQEKERLGEKREEKRQGQI